MKRMLNLLCGLLLSAAATAQVTRTSEGVTFTVDGPLEAQGTMYMDNGEQVARFWTLAYSKTGNQSYIASSFRDQTLTTMGESALYGTIVRAYARHYSLVLSPDMIWLNICQVFDQYVNQHAEELRGKFVSHEGKADLMVETAVPITSPQFDWQKTIDGFIEQIGKHTKDGIADVVVADFSTTTPTTRIASGITLMDITREYFEYFVLYFSCGIPSITLTGTPDDWRSVLRRTEALEKYGMAWWTKDLKPILQQFIRAAEGKPDQKFWKDIVMRDRPDRVRGNGCNLEGPTVFDGWFTKLFPYNKDGKTSFEYTIDSKEMLSSIVRVPFRYVELSPTGEVLKRVPMELWAGFIGARVDEEKHVLTPEIGWLAREAESDQQIHDVLMEKSNSRWGLEGLKLRIYEVPEHLRGLKSIGTLDLTFLGQKVVLPEWMDEIKIGTLRIEGKMTKAEADAIQKRFKQASIKRK